MNITSSSITLERLRFYAFHGVLPQERRVGGDYVVSLTADCDITRAAESDCVDDTVNYAAVYAVVKREMMVPSQLLEHVAARIARAVMSEFGEVSRVSIALTKCNPPMGADGDGATVRLTMER